MLILIIVDFGINVVYISLEESLDPLFRPTMDDVMKKIWSVDIILELFFLVEIFVRFFAAYKDKEGNHHYNCKEISCRYLKTWFLFDFITWLPIEMIQTKVSFRFIHMLRIIKFVTRIWNINEIVAPLMIKNE